MVLLVKTATAREADVKVGWHAIEYLLWGTDVSKGKVLVLEQLNEFAKLDSNMRCPAGTTGTDIIKCARSKYLWEVTLGLEKYLKTLEKEWNPNGSSTNYLRANI